jgi:hypothetical protein
LRTDRAARTLAEARTCYDHLAGRRGVELRDRLLNVGALQMIDDRDHELTPRGQELMQSLGIDARQLNTTRRVFARVCVDWTQRRPHLAGALAAGMTRRFLDLGWVAHGSGRSLRVARDYDDRLDAWLSG